MQSGNREFPNEFADLQNIASFRKFEANGKIVSVYFAGKDSQAGDIIDFECFALRILHPDIASVDGQYGLFAHQARVRFGHSRALRCQQVVGAEHGDDGKKADE